MGILKKAVGVVGTKIVTEAISNTAIAVSTNLKKKNKIDQQLLESGNTLPNFTKSKITVKCCGCKVPITNYLNTFVKCEYCDTEQVLKLEE